LSHSLITGASKQAMEQQNNSAKSSQNTPNIQVHGDYVVGDKVGGDKIGGNKISQDYAQEEQTVTPAPVEKHTRYFIIIVIILLVIALSGTIAWIIFSQQSEDKFIFQVRVQDQTTSDPIKNAQVTLDIEGENIPKSKITDSDGLALFSISNDLSEATANLTIQTNGYHIRNKIIQVEPDQLPIIINLEETP
jgi:flagellar basal body-associated protein FliL